MQNKKNKKQNGGEAEGQIIFTYVLLTFLVGFIGYCIYWCFSSGPENCEIFKDLLFQGDDDSLKKAWSYFLVPDPTITTKKIGDKVKEGLNALGI